MLVIIQTENKPVKCAVVLLEVHAVVAGQLPFKRAGLVLMVDLHLAPHILMRDIVQTVIAERGHVSDRGTAGIGSITVLAVAFQPCHGGLSDNRGHLPLHGLHDMTYAGEVGIGIERAGQFA